MMQQNTVYKKSSLNKNNRLKVKYQKNMNDSNIERKNSHFNIRQSRLQNEEHYQKEGHYMIQKGSFLQEKKVGGT